MSNEIWRRLGRKEYLKLHCLFGFIYQKNTCSVSYFKFIHFKSWFCFFLKVLFQLRRDQTRRTISLQMAPLHWMTVQKSRWIELPWPRSFSFLSVHLSWVISKECQRLAWLAQWVAMQCWAVSVALQPTVWATRARSSARGIHSDHFHSIEGIPRTHANGSADTYTAEQGDAA